MLLLTLTTLQLAVPAAFAASQDWTEGMFPFQLSTGDLVRLPGSHGCKYVLCPANGLTVYGTDCRGVPAYPDGDVEESRLLLLNTGIEALVAGDFTTWGRLTSLRIESNTELRTIEPRVFFHMTSLTNLSISNNYRLEVLDSEVFDGLLNLRELRFVKNNLKTLYRFSLAVRPYLLPSLVFLDLSENPLGKVSRASFAEMEDSPLEVLVLKFCNLDWIEPDSFHGLNRLTSLDLGNNNLNSEILIEVVASFNFSSVPIRHLGLSANLLNENFDFLLQVISHTNISSLDISSNHFGMLSDHFFPYMPNLETLNLKQVSAFDVELQTFAYSRLPKLKTLYFPGNRLSGFIEGLQLPHLQVLDISENNCVDCTVTSLFKLEENDLQNMKSLEVLSLSRNNIYHVSRFMFFGLESIRALYLSNCSIFSIEDYSFADLSRLEHLDLSMNQFAAKEKLVAETFEGLISITSLRLDSCYINDLDPEVFKYTTSLKYLTLMNNDLLQIDPMLLAPLVGLVRIDLTNNVILPWEREIFSGNKELENLSVASNHLYKYTPEMLSDLSYISVINMRDNPLKCNCDLVRTLMDTDLKPENMFGLNDTVVRCPSTGRWANEEVLSFVQAKSVDYECIYWGVYASVLGVCVLFALIVLFVGAYYLRWHLRYWLFLFKQSWRASFSGQRPARANAKYKYDAFVSYSNEDRNFVIRMVAMMENYEPYFRLCVFERDFNAGDVICESVVDCLDVSKKTILVLTDAFARSQWCQWELQMAHHKRFFFKSDSQDSLILIKLGDIMDAHMTPTLRYLMKTRIYLQWYSDPKRQRVFWQKLREALHSKGDTQINV